MCNLICLSIIKRLKLNATNCHTFSGQIKFYPLEYANLERYGAISQSRNLSMGEESVRLAGE